MHAHILAWIHHYGYFGVFLILLLEMIGIPFPAETTLTISGFELSDRTFSFLPLLIAAVAGNVIGSMIAYGIGRLLGRPVVVGVGKYVGITDERFDKAEAIFRRYQAWVVLFGKFIAGIRVLVPYVAGIERMALTPFVVLNAISALIWVSLFTLLGHLLGEEWVKYHTILQQFLLPGGIILALAVVGWIFWKIRKRSS